MHIIQMFYNGRILREHNILTTKSAENSVCLVRSERRKIPRITTRPTGNWKKAVNNHGSKTFENGVECGTAFPDKSLERRIYHGVHWVCIIEIKISLGTLDELLFYLHLRIFNLLRQFTD